MRFGYKGCKEEEAYHEWLRNPPERVRRVLAGEMTLEELATGHQRTKKLPPEKKSSARSYRLELLGNRQEIDLTATDLEVPDNLPGIFNAVENFAEMVAHDERRPVEQLMAEYAPTIIRVIPDGGYFRSLDELRVVAANCCEDVDEFRDDPFGYLYSVYADLGYSSDTTDELGLELRVIGTWGFSPGRRSEARQYADSVKNVLGAALGDGVAAKIDRAYNLRATMAEGPWGRSLWALPWKASAKAINKAVDHADVDTLVLPVSEEELPDCQRRAAGRKKSACVHSFGSFERDAFEWELTRAAEQLVKPAAPPRPTSSRASNRKSSARARKKGTR